MVRFSLPAALKRATWNSTKLRPHSLAAEPQPKRRAAWLTLYPAGCLLSLVSHCFTERGSETGVWLSWNVLCRWEGPWPQRFACPCFWSTGVKGVHYHIWLSFSNYPLQPLFTCFRTKLLGFLFVWDRVFFKKLHLPLYLGICIYVCHGTCIKGKEQLLGSLVFFYFCFWGKVSCCFCPHDVYLSFPDSGWVSSLYLSSLKGVLGYRSKPSHTYTLSTWF